MPAQDNTIQGQTIQTIFVEITVPKKVSAGTYKGSIGLSSQDGIKGTIPVQLTVYNVTIPDTLSFVIELNAYGQRSKDNFYAIHRLAHRFRLGYNALGYSHSGNWSLPFIPAIQGKGKDAKVKDWSAWDEWMGPLLDGSLLGPAVTR